MQEMWVQSLGGEDPLVEGTATHSSILIRKTPWMVQHGSVQSIGSQKVRTLLKRFEHVLHTHTHVHKMGYNLAIKENEILPR